MKNYEPKSYVVYDYENDIKPEILFTEAKTLTFPLSQEDLNDIKTLEVKYDRETNCAGIAAPQIGINKKIIIFAVKDTPELKKWRPDLTQTMPKTLWINPSYENIGTDKHEDYEGCFSVKDLAGRVKRFKKIRYKAYDLKGKLIEGEAEGFLARIIQHEIDHVNGILFTLKAEKGTLFTIEEYRRMRKASMEKDK